MKSGLLVAAAMAASQVAAQPATVEAGTLRPVVVTPGQGVAQPAFDAPASVDVIDRTTLRSGQLGINLSETLVRVPGVVALNRQNYAQDLQISVRGYGARATFGVRGLRLLTDGIPATAPDGQGQISHFDLASADRLEVLRGPFSPLYGNASGGVISLFTADGGPGTEAEVGLAWGSDAVRRVNARVAGEAGAWSFHFNAVRFETGGFRDFSAARRTGFNGKLKFRASDDTRLTLVVNQMDMPDVQDPQGLTRAEYEATPRAASAEALLFNTRKSVNQLQAGLILEHRLNAAQSLKLTAWRGERGTQQYQSIPVATQQASPNHPGGVIDLARRYQGLDAQWVGKTTFLGTPFSLTAGLLADGLQENRRGFENFRGTQLGVPGALRRDEDNRVRSFDQYLQAQWKRERFTLTAGLRHSSVKFRSHDRFLSNGDGSGSTRYSATTLAAGLVWHVADRLNVYGALGRGFETPTFNEVAYRPGGAPGLNLDLQPATSRQWELGLKAEPLPRWKLNVALFQASTDQEIVVLTNAGGRSTFQNAGETRRRGLEALLQGAWGDGWSLLLAATALDARYRTGFLTCGPPPCLTAAVPVAAGNRMPGIPRSSVFAELAWRHRPWGLETAVEFRHQGRMAVNDTQSDHAAAANLFNARISLEQKAGRWTVREFLRVDNLADRRHVGAVIVNGANQRFFEPGPGRTWLAGVNASYAF